MTKTGEVAEPSWANPAKRYGLALALVAAAALLCWALPGTLAATPYLAFYPAIMAAAAFGGLGPGVLATIASAVLINLWLDTSILLPVPGLGQVPLPTAGEAARLAILLGGGLVISLVAGAKRRLRDRAASQAQELEDSRRRLWGIIESAMDAIISIDEDQKIVLFNPAAERMFGCPADQALGTSIDRFIPSRYRAAHRGHVQNFAATGRTSRAMGQLGAISGLRTSGEEFPIEASISQVTVGGRKLLSVILRDDTTRQRAEVELRRREAKFRELADSMPQIIWAARPDGYVDYYNRQWYELTGADPSAVGDQSWLPILHPDDRQRCIEAWYAAVRSGQPYQIQYRYKFPGSGQYRWHLGRALPVRDEHGQIVRWYGTSTDIHNLKTAQEQVRLQAAALEAAASGILITDAAGNAVWANQAFYTMTGYSPQEVIGQNPRMLKSDQQDATFYHELWATIRRGEIWHGELVNRRKDGSTYVEDMLISPLRNEHGAIINFIAVKQDVSERKAAQEALAQAKAKAEEASRAKDQFLAVLSHELRNPLTPVLATASFLQEDPRLDADTREQLAMVHRNAELEAQLIDDLLDVTRITRGKVELHRQPVAVGEVLRRAVEVCQSDLEARHLHFGLDAQGGPFIVEADPARLQQVFWNLLKNAIKFTPEGGCVGVRARGDPANHHVVVEVLDSGIGIEPEALARIFHPFEQAERAITRQFGGLGLGLTITKAMVELHGGRIEAHSPGKNQGATFRVQLPLLAGEALQQARAPAEGPAAATRPMRPLRILLVEDHGDTARIMSRLLRAEGHAVEHAADVATALRLLDGQPFDLLVSDLGLPDGSGLDIMAGARHRGLDLPGIALSGYGLEQDVRRSREAGFAAHVTKPVDFRAVTGAIRQVIDRPAQRPDTWRVRSSP